MKLIVCFTLLIMILTVCGCDNKKGDVVSSSSEKPVSQDNETVSFKEEVSSVISEVIDNSPFTPSPKNPNALPSDTEIQIVNALFSKYTSTYGSDTGVTTDLFKIKHYFGTYSGCTAFTSTDNFEAFVSYARKENIDGVVIHYNDAKSIQIWNGSEICDLKTAYNKKMITKDDLKNIAYYQNTEVSVRK